jgi:hypothetical protein
MIKVPIPGGINPPQIQKVSHKNLREIAAT